MLCYTMISHAMLRNDQPCYVTQSSAMLCYVMISHVMLRNDQPCYGTQVGVVCHGGVYCKSGNKTLNALI